MKKIIILSVLAFLFIGCSSDEGGEPNTLDTNYFPDNTGNTWVYDYSIKDKGVETQGETTTKIGASETVEGVDYKTLEGSSKVIGLMDKIHFRRDKQELIIRPKIDVNYGDMQAAILDEIKLIGSSAAGSVMSDVKNTFKQGAVQIPENEYNLKGTIEPVLNLKATSTFVSKHNEANFGNTTYKDIYQTQVDLFIGMEVLIDAKIGPLPVKLRHKLIKEQKFGKLEIWFAKGKGIVGTKYIYSFKNLEINNTLGIAAGISIDLNNLIPDLQNIINSVSLEREGKASLKTANITN